jgi:2-hydroxychromene-2-carboxylate isomerase
MIDGEGGLGNSDAAKRTTAVENHYKWVDAAKYLGCHSIRVNAETDKPYEEGSKLAADGLRRLSEYAKPLGINVIVENHGGLSSDGKWLSETIRATGMDNCGTLPDFGNFYDPVGAPIKQGYSLYMWARSQGRGNDLMGAFLKAAFARGINTDSLSGMRRVVEMAGLDWAEARRHLHDDTWAAELEENRLNLYAAGLWGVPSYRLLDSAGNEILSVWGQDRLWLVSRRIAEHARSKPASWSLARRAL